MAESPTLDKPEDRAPTPKIQPPIQDQELYISVNTDRGIIHPDKANDPVEKYGEGKPVGHLPLFLK